MKTTSTSKELLTLIKDHFWDAVMLGGAFVMTLSAVSPRQSIFCLIAYGAAAAIIQQMHTKPRSEELLDQDREELARRLTSPPPLRLTSAPNLPQRPESSGR